MRIGDLLPLINENRVVIIKANNKEVARYDGKDSISKQYDDCNVINVDIDDYAIVIETVSAFVFEIGQEVYQKEDGGHVKFGIVTRFDDLSGYGEPGIVYVLWRDGSFGHYTCWDGCGIIKRCGIIKTGRNFEELNTILGVLGEGGTEGREWN